MLLRTFPTQAVTTVVGTFCFPIDTIKRRLMVQRKILPTAGSTTGTSSSGSRGGSGSAATTADSATHATSTAKPKHATHIPYKNGFDCARRIVVEEGVKGLFAGLSVNLVRGFTGAILLVAYDDIKKRL